MALLRIKGVGPLHPKIMIVGEWPHEADLRKGEPFIGGVGFEFTKMLQEAGIRRDDCYLTTVMKTRVFPGTKLIATTKKEITPQHIFFQGEHVLPELYDAAMELRREIEQTRPNVICVSGDVALWALTGQTSSHSWRSSIMDSVLVEGIKVIPTLSFNLVHVQWAKRPWIVHDLKRVLRNSLTPGLFTRDYKFLIAVNNSDEQFQSVRNQLESLITSARTHLETFDTRLEVSGDIETRKGHISCIAFGWSNTEALCIQFMKTNSPEGFWETEQEAEFVYLIRQLAKYVQLIGQNWNYDAQYIFRHWGFLFDHVDDTMIRQHSAFSNLPKNLAFLSSMYCEDHLYWKDDRVNWEEGQDGEGEMQYWRYNCTDAVRTYAINNVLKGVLKGMGLETVYDFQSTLRPKVLKTMIRGVRVNNKLRGEFSMQLMEEAGKRVQWMRDVLGYELNIRSPKQLQDFFYRQMGLKPLMDRKTGSVTTDDAALRTIAAREPILLPITRKIAELRSLGVFHSTFVLAPLDRDGRMRCTFNLCGTETYRFASSKNAFDTGMNMQNIPKGGETEDDGLELPNIRKLFIPDEGMGFFDIDLDSADLRIVTWESDCAWMKEHFKNGRKPYVEVMREYYHDNTMTKNSHPREYAMFKSLCHGTNYLGTADGIAPRIGLNVHETERIQKWYFELAPEIRKWQENVKKQVSSRRYVENAFGYRNYFFDKIEGTIFNQAVAWIPQSTVACLINRAYVAIDDNMPEVEILLQVHDSLAGQFPLRKKEEMLKGIQEHATIAIPYDDPLYIPVGVVSSANSWGDCD